MWGQEPIKAPLSLNFEETEQLHIALLELNKSKGLTAEQIALKEKIQNHKFKLKDLENHVSNVISNRSLMNEMMPDFLYEAGS